MSFPQMVLRQLDIHLEKKNQHQPLTHIILKKITSKWTRALNVK